MGFISFTARMLLCDATSGVPDVSCTMMFRAFFKLVQFALVVGA